MKYLALSFVLLMISNFSYACFQLDKRKLENHLFIKGFTVNHRLVLLDEKGEEIKSFGRTSVSDKNGKKNLKSYINFANGMIQINADQFKKDPVVLIKFLDLKKEIKIEVDLKKSATKSMTRSSGTCAGELSFESY